MKEKYMKKFLFLLSILPMFIASAQADTLSDLQAKVTAIQSAVSTVETKAGEIDALADDIDALAITLEGENVCDPEDPPSSPTPVDCLAGTNPSWNSSNMYSDELNETAWLNARTTFRTTMANAPSGSIMLLGDSMLANIDEEEISEHAINFGISGESIRQLLYRINDPDINNAPNLIHRAGAVVILTGINDGSDSRNGTQSNAAATVNIVYDKLSGWLTGKVVIVKLVKLNTSVFSTPSNTAFVDAVNSWIDTEFGSNPNVRIVDVNPTVAPSGSLLSTYSTDGQHLNTTAGKAVLQNAIKDALIDLNVIAE